MSAQKNILIMTTGSVAAIKLPNLIRQLQKESSSPSGRKYSIRVACTEPSVHFFSIEEVDKLLEETSDELTSELEKKCIFRDVDEWSAWSTMGDPVLHIVLRNWADIGVIAPLDANTLGKMSAGMCDNLVTCILRAWDVSKPLVYAPAMNVNMWDHPMTKKCLEVPQQLGYIQVGPIEKKLACGDTGIGAMAEVEQIVEEINKLADCHTDS